MKRMKRLTALLLLICVTAISVPEQVNAYSYMTSRDNLSTSEVLAGIAGQTFNSSMTADRARTYITHFINNTAAYRKVPNGSGAQKTATDGTYTTALKWGSTGCYHYADFVNTTMYGGSGEARVLTQSGGVTAASLKEFLQRYGQAGEHIRLDGCHSLIYISATESGFYTLQYYGNGENPFLSFVTFEYFAGIINSSGRAFWIYEADTALNNGATPPVVEQPPVTNPVQPPAGNAGTGGATFLDVPVGHEFYSYIEYLYSEKVVKGYGSSGYFGVEDTLRRDHAAKMIANGAGLNSAGLVAGFADVAANDEFSPYIAALVNVGAINGNKSTFRPQEFITREEIAQIVVKAFKLERGPIEVSFSDLPAGEAGECITILASNGIVSGYGGTMIFGPYRNATRGEFAKMLTGAMAVAGG